MRRLATRAVDPQIFWIAFAVAALFVLWGALFTDNLAAVAKTVLDWIISTFGWVFILSTALFLAFTLFLAFGRFGHVRLGKDDEKPEFSTLSWIAMMFSAGMGIGLMFFGVAEPISHLASPPLGLAEPNTEEAARLAMQYSYFHWALHPWAIYAVVGLALAYSTFRKGRPNLISSTFTSVLGDRVGRGPGKTIEILAIFATLFGSATSLGLGAAQIDGGLNFLWDVPISAGIQIAVIVVVTVLFILSAVSGVSRGIQYLSNLNGVLAVLLALFLFLVGPTVFILNNLTESFGGYMNNLIPMSFRAATFGQKSWLTGWTIFYWAWWISWAPFVGAFIARISRGRTIREFVLGVLLAPSMVTFIWFAVFGGAALELQLSGGADIAAAVSESQEVALFSVLEQFPFEIVTSLVTIFLVALFFISGADAASVVMGMLSCRGTLSPQRGVVITWGALTGLAAIVLLLAGGLVALQQASIIVALPFTFVMVGLCYALLEDLRSEPRPGLVPARPLPDRGEPALDGVMAPSPERSGGAPGNPVSGREGTR
ncbi:MAG TPA: BCCT family transporter [Jiangellaceae bacterium]|nr:BCCT family transporter [Jiangellaceae bacterium]